jgi:hypothetical protein
VTCCTVQPVAIDKGIEVMPAMMGIEPAGKLERTESLLPEGNVHPLKFVLEKAVVEANVVGHEQLAVENLQQVVAQFGKDRGIPDHGIGNAGIVFDEGRNRPFRIDQGTPCPNQFTIGDFAEADFDNPIPGSICPRRFEVEKNGFLVEHGENSGKGETGFLVSERLPRRLQRERI